MRQSAHARGSGWAHARPTRGCLYGATHSQQLVELAGEGKQLHRARHRGQHSSDAARRSVDVEIRVLMAQQKPALSNSKPRGECVSRYLARLGDDHAIHKEKATHTCRRLPVQHLPWRAEKAAARQTRLKT